MSDKEKSNQDAKNGEERRATTRDRRVNKADRRSAERVSSARVPRRQDKDRRDD